MTVWDLAVVVCDLVLAIVINTSASILGGSGFDFCTWYQGCACAFFTNILIQLILPVPHIAKTICKPLLKTKACWVLTVFIENLIYVTCISLTMAFLFHGNTPVLDAWLSTYLALVFIGYGTSLVLFAICNREHVLGTFS